MEDAAEDPVLRISIECNEQWIPFVVDGNDGCECSSDSRRRHLRYPPVLGDS